MFISPSKALLRANRQAASAPDFELISLPDLGGRLMLAVRAAYPGNSISSLKLKVRLFVRIAQNLSELRRMYSDKSNPALLEMLDERPSWVAAVDAPYLHAQWTASKKLEIISRHYRYLTGRLAFLRFNPGASVLIADVPNAAGLQLSLDKAPWFMREGELVLSLLENDVRFYSVAFTLGCDGDENVAYVGALQGYGGEDALDIYRRLTRTLHDMRPRDFLMAAFRLLSAEFNVQTILAVSDKARLHQSTYHSGHEGVAANYDEIWREFSDDKLVDGFWKISPVLKYRTAAQIPTRKRAMYRRRYEMLDNLRGQIEQSQSRAIESAASTR
jgi:uncharacterized protein VirK/YbjX